MRLLKIARGTSRFDKHWKNVDVSWDELANELSRSQETRETHEEYVQMKKDAQDNIKDIGGFVGGTIRDGIRKKENIIGRDLITLDLDDATVDFWDEFTAWNEFACCVYSTHKSTPSKPRLRLVAPLSRTCTQDEYEAVSRRIGQYVGLKMLDKTTFQPSRLMYYPSHSRGSTPIYYKQDGAWIDVDNILATYRDWHDISEYPLCDGELEIKTSKRVKPEDPTTKNGIIGVFCRTYDVPSAIETFIPEVYEKSGENRYTYTSATTSNGLVIYDDGLRAYSNHATDPAYGISLNAFDIVRIHRFGDLDSKAKDGTPVNKLPSYLAMSELASEDEEVKKTLVSEKVSSLEDDFNDVDAIATDSHTVEDALSNLSNLKLDKHGDVLPTIDNYSLILENDPRIKNFGRFNEFNYRKEEYQKSKFLPNLKTGVTWSDADLSIIYRFIETNYGKLSRPAVDNALTIYFNNHSYHPVKQYIESLTWDGTPRVETLFIDWLDAKDNDLTRFITKKLLVAAIKRIYEPGCKFDQMVTVAGGQGIGKSELFKRLGCYKWYTSAITRLDTSKETLERMLGMWIIEVAEMSAANKVELEEQKNAITTTTITVRMAYAKEPTTFERQSVFVATTNRDAFLRDPTGDRRYWIVDCMDSKISKSHVYTHFTQDIVDQVWAEAKVMYDNGEANELSLPPNLEEVMETYRQSATVLTGKESLVEEYLNTPLPELWEEATIQQRRDYIHGNEVDAAVLYGGDPTVLYERKYVCVQEILCELFQYQPGKWRKPELNEVVEIMGNMPGWTKIKDNYRTREHYGRVAVYERNSLRGVYSDRGKPGVLITQQMPSQSVYDDDKAFDEGDDF